MTDVPRNTCGTCKWWAPVKWFRDDPPEFLKEQVGTCHASAPQYPSQQRKRQEIRLGGEHGCWYALTITETRWPATQESEFCRYHEAVKEDQNVDR